MSLKGNLNRNEKKSFMINVIPLIDTVKRIIRPTKKQKIINKKFKILIFVKISTDEIINILDSNDATQLFSMLPENCL